MGTKRMSQSVKHRLLKHQPSYRSRGRTGKTSPAFTLVELLIVIIVIAILAAITIVAYNGITNRARDTAALSNVKQAGEKVTVYAITNGEVLPTTLAEAGITNSGDLTYQYTPNTTTNPDTFCLTATSGGVSAHVAGSTAGVNTATNGPCPGHTGTAPTTLADGSSCPTGYIVVPGSSLYNTDAFCVMKYEAKNDGAGNPVSTTGGTPWVSISQTSAIAEASSVPGCSTCHLITEAEWLTIAQNVMSVSSNWSGGAVGNGYMYRGHSDNAPANSLAAAADNDGYNGTGQTSPSEQRRTLTLTNGEVIWDLAGNVWEWTDATTEGGNQPGASGYAWRDWNALTTHGNLNPDPFPSYANPSANSWNSGQNIGRIYSNSSEAGLRAFLRGGLWGSGANAGVFTLHLSYSPSSTNAGIGFRVARGYSGP